MSEANTPGVVGQGRFGPPPIVGFTVTAFTAGHDHWRLKISAVQDGGEWMTTTDWHDARRSDVLEAIMVEVQRLLRV